MARFSLPPGDRTWVARGADLLKRSSAADQVEVALVHPDGSKDAIMLPPTAAGLIGELLGKISTSGRVALLEEEAEISPEAAASILGISRPLVRRRMDTGVLAFRRVGAHRRLRLADVLALKEQEAPVRAALAALKADTDDLMAHGL